MSKLLDRACDACEAGRFTEALDLLTEMFREVQNMEGLQPFPSGIRRADKLLEALGKRLWSELPSAQPPDELRGDLVLDTTLYVTGGRTAVIRDLASALPEKPIGLWLTHACEEDPAPVPAEAVERTGLQDSIRSFEENDRWLCARKISGALTKARPARLFLLHHPYDCVAVVVAAFAAEMGCDICLLHHADNSPSSGLYLTGAKIYDFTPRAVVFSRSILGLTSAWLPLTCPDPQASGHAFRGKGPLVTALSGGRNKIQQMQSPDYPELIAAVLERSGGRHVHIGPTRNSLRKRTARLLKDRGISADRVRWVPGAATIVAALNENDVDLMINTYPRGGARTAVECMAAGRPMLWHSPTADLDRLWAQMKYPEAPIWRTLAQLRELVGAADASWLNEQGTAARRWYLSRHHPNLWRDSIANFQSALQRELPDGLDSGLVVNGLMEEAVLRASRDPCEKVGMMGHLRQALTAKKRL